MRRRRQQQVPTWAKPTISAEAGAKAPLTLIRQNMPGAEGARPPGAAVGNELNNLSYCYPIIGVYRKRVRLI